MKKIVIVLILAGVVILTIVFSLKDKPVVDAVDNPAQFAFEANLQIACNQEVEVAIDIFVDDVALIEVSLNDSVIAKFSDPDKKEVKFMLDGAESVGAKKLKMVTSLTDGSEFTDERIVRVLSDITPIKMKAEIVKTYPHNSESFTQGLEFFNGKLYESTGLLGQSNVFEVDLLTGKINEQKKMGLDATHFGEGITIFKGVIYQLTWQNQKCITYDLNDAIVPKSEFAYRGEGWGICNDGKSLIMSNGTEQLTFRNPNTFVVEKTIEVYNHVGPQIALNELEYIDGLIYANVWQTTRVVVIDPANGKILREIDGTDLLMKGQGPSQDVMNGIAFDPATNKTYMTGKKWSSLFEVRFVKN